MEKCLQGMGALSFDKNTVLQICQLVVTCIYLVATSVCLCWFGITNIVPDPKINRFSIK